jgi:hypothetical protein
MTDWKMDVCFVAEWRWDDVSNERRQDRRDGRCELEWNHKDRDSGLPLPLQII